MRSSIAQVRWAGGASGLPATDRSVVDDDDLFAGFDEVVGGGESRDAGADDADVGGQVAGEGREVWDFEGAHPYRSGVAGRVGVGGVGMHRSKEVIVSR